ncbi:Unknown protein [Striga hermonthica]|uniref:Uncharacterized protein n=1 Tax=Striga hermonthica TaxID=68872 RepID=A0A9N7NS69_STRHE|nr:Unknown protein [Striga hermonthica]
MTFSPTHQGEAGTSRGLKRDRSLQQGVDQTTYPPRRVNTSRGDSLLSRRQTKAYACKAYYVGQRVQHAGSRPTTKLTTNKISFTNEDAFLFDHPHSDAFVITTPIMEIKGFNGQTTLHVGQFVLPIKFGGNGQPTRTILKTFKIVDCPSEYNAIIGRTALYKLKDAVSIFHYSIKLLTSDGEGTYRGDQREWRTEGEGPAKSRSLRKMSSTPGTNMNKRGGPKDVFAWTYEDMVGIDPHVACHRL